MGHVYGIDAFLRDARVAFGFRPGPRAEAHLKVLYLTVAPAAVAAILLFSWWRYEPLSRGEYRYPDWANALGWAVAAVAILPVFLVAAGLVGHRMLVAHRRERFTTVRHLNASNQASITTIFTSSIAAGEVDIF